MLIKNLKSKSKARLFTAIGLSTGNMHPELVHDMCWEERPGKWAAQNKAVHAPAFPGNAPSLIKKHSSHSRSRRTSCSWCGRSEGWSVDSNLLLDFDVLLGSESSQVGGLER